MDPMNTPEATSEDLDINTDPPTKKEIITTIKSLSNGKLKADMFKINSVLAANILLPLLTDIWMERKILSDWPKWLIIQVPKKGTLSDCNNWRGITLLFIPSKKFGKIIVPRLQL